PKSRVEPGSTAITVLTTHGSAVGGQTSLATVANAGRADSAARTSEQQRSVRRMCMEAPHYHRRARLYQATCERFSAIACAAPTALPGCARLPAEPSPSPLHRRRRARRGPLTFTVRVRT